MADNPQPDPSSSKANMDDRTKSTIIIAFRHVKRQMNRPINDPQVTSDIIRKVILLLRDPDFMGKPLQAIPTLLSLRNTWKFYTLTDRVYKERKGRSNDSRHTLDGRINNQLFDIVVPEDKETSAK